MKIIAVVPVKGREEIIKVTIPRLARQVFKVIVAGHTESECDICESAGVDFYLCKGDILLGAKWQFIIDKAREYNPDAILILGSGGVISDDYCEQMFPDLEEYSMTGKAGVHVFDTMRNGTKRMIYWPGYTGARGIEPQGNGRLFSAKFLDSCNWQIYDKKRNGSLDGATMTIIHRNHGTIKSRKGETPYVMRISSWQYMQKDPFDRLAKYAGVRKIENIDEILSKIGL